MAAIERFFKRRKEAKLDDASESPTVRMSSGTKSLVLLGIAPPLIRNKRFEIPAEGGTIGSLPENTISIQDGQRSVSRTHVRVLFSAADGCYHVADLNSSNGSTLATDTTAFKMTTQTYFPLKPGYIIKLGGDARFLVAEEDEERNKYMIELELGERMPESSVHSSGAAKSASGGGTSSGGLAISGGASGGFASSSAPASAVESVSGIFTAAEVFDVPRIQTAVVTYNTVLPPAVYGPPPASTALGPPPGLASGDGSLGISPYNSASAASGGFYSSHNGEGPLFVSTHAADEELQRLMEDVGIVQKRERVPYGPPATTTTTGAAPASAAVAARATARTPANTTKVKVYLNKADGTKPVQRVDVANFTSPIDLIRHLYTLFNIAWARRVTYRDGENDEFDILGTTDPNVLNDVRAYAKTIQIYP